MKLDKNYKVRVTPEQSREIHSLILLDGGEVSYGLKPQLQDEFLVIENDHGSVVIYYTDQDIFLSAEQQEIQADDLIALLTDLSKSAENLLQGVELTPEFETEASEPKFQVGDKVYVGLTGKITRVTKIIDDDVASVTNKNNEVWAGISNICHATQENYERLQATFPDIEFEKPPTQADIDNEAVDKLAQAMKNKLAKKREQGYHGWETCKHGDLVQLLINHVDKGDPIDVANFCAFLFARGEPLTEAVLDE